MHASRALVLCLAALCATAALAQDAAPRARERKPKLHAAAKSAHGDTAAAPGAAPPARTDGQSASAPPRPVDPRLAARLVQAIRRCYEDEAHKDFQPEDQALLVENADTLVRELEPGLDKTGCKAGGEPSESCLLALDALACDELARPIKRNRWDRHLLAADRKQIAAYTGALAEHKADCRAKRGVDADPVEEEVDASRLGLLVAMNLTSGRCQLDPRGRPACETKLGKLSCDELEAAIVHNRLINVCSMYLRCKDVGLVVE